MLRHDTVISKSSEWTIKWTWDCPWMNSLITSLRTPSRILDRIISFNLDRISRVRDLKYRTIHPHGWAQPSSMPSINKFAYTLFRACIVPCGIPPAFSAVEILCFNLSRIQSFSRLLKFGLSLLSKAAVVDVGVFIRKTIIAASVTTSEIFSSVVRSSEGETFICTGSAPVKIHSTSLLLN